VHAPPEEGACVIDGEAEVQHRSEELALGDEPIPVLVHAGEHHEHVAAGRPVAAIHRRIPQTGWGAPISPALRRSSVTVSMCCPVVTTVHGAHDVSACALRRPRGDGGAP
jgi:hypothetical protein